MLPEGTFYAQARSGGLGETTKEGKPQVSVEFEVTSAEFAGQRITWYGYFTEKTEKRTLESLRIAGWTGTDISDLSELSGDTPMVELVVEHEKYNGTVSAKVRWVNREGGARGVPLPADKAKALAARLRGKLAEVDQQIGKKPEAKPAAKARAPLPSRPSRQEQHAEDDIPF